MVIDTNVLVSAVWRDRTPEAVVRWVLAEPNCHWVVTDEILAEYLEVLARPRFALPIALLQGWRTLLERRTTRWVAESVQFQRDPKDAKFIACVVAAGADVLLTGDGDFEGAPAEVVRVKMTVRQFHGQFVQPGASGGDGE